MRINLKATNVELTDAIRDHVEKKVGGLEKYLSNMGEAPSSEGQRDPVEVDVEVGKSNNHHKKGDDAFMAEINMAVPGTKHVLRSVSEQWDLYVAIDEAKDEMERQLKRFKGKQDTKRKKGRRSLKKLLRFSKLAQDPEQE